MATTSDIRNGLCIRYNSDIYKIIEFLHVKPGKGGAYLQVEMKDNKEGTKKNSRFRSSESVERAVLDEKEYQFLFT